jgi:hypothetical protein
MLWFNKGCSAILDQREKANLQWLQDLSEINGGNLNNIRHEATKHLGNKKQKYVKDKIKRTVRTRTLEIELCRGIN